MGKKVFFAACCAMLLCNGAPRAFADESAPVKAAQNWLALVDKDQYPQSWETASAFFKTTIAKEQWGTLVGTFRKPLGKLTSRRLKVEQMTTSLPGVPDGEYDVIVFDTVFENKASASEMVTMTKEKDGTWRTTGYIIR